MTTIQAKLKFMTNRGPVSITVDGPVTPEDARSWAISECEWRTLTRMQEYVLVGQVEVIESVVGA